MEKILTMNEYIIKLDSIIFALILLGFVLVYLMEQNQKKQFQNKLFRLLVFSVIVMLVIEIPYLLINGNARWARFIFILKSVYHVLKIIPLIIYVLLVDSVIFNNKIHTKHTLWLWLPYIVLTMALSLLNFIFPLFFTVDTTGTYQQLRFIPVLFALQYIPILAVIRLLIAKRHRLDKKQLYLFWFIPVPVFIVSLFQLFESKLALTWPFVSLGIVGLGLAMQQKRLTEDYLTGAYNRQHLDAYLEHKLRNCKPNKTFAAFLIDV
ncbi:hypothetical protein, partial [Gracilinema caldarium]|uniref:hypothetical protein n=1 Tax=Gracilinema caldarium TaxID=215591 RepID=UPI0026EA58C9